MEKKDDGCSGCGGTQVLIDAGKNNLVQQNTPCSGCGSRKISQKLGTCKECIISNIIGAIFCWITFCIFFFLFPFKNAVIISFVFASFFTLLLSAHGIAFLVKRNKTKNS